MLTRLLALAATAGLLSIATPAIAADVTTTTRVRHDVVETFVDIIPSCEGGGPRFNITTTATTVTHRTRIADGWRLFHVTTTGTFVAEPRNDFSLPNYTGRFTQAGTFSIENGDATGTFRFSVRGRGSDGSFFTNHSVEHFNERPDGTSQQFFHCH